MGKPAATLTSYHVCPDKTGKKKHVGGPVATSSSNVFVGGLPVARIGDSLVCRGPSDTIAEGSASVSANGKAVARTSDGTAHGGKIVEGNPTVLIGDAGPSSVADSGSGGVATLVFGKGGGAAASSRSSAGQGGNPAPYAPRVDLGAQRAAILKGMASCPVCEAATV